MWPTNWAIDQTIVKKDVNLFFSEVQHVKCLKRLPAPPFAFEPYQLTKEASALQQQSMSTLLKLAGANFKHLDPLVLKPPSLKAVLPSKALIDKMTSIPPSIPTFTPADMEQIVA